MLRWLQWCLLVLVLTGLAGCATPGGPLHSDVPVPASSTAPASATIGIYPALTPSAGSPSSPTPTCRHYAVLFDHVVTWSDPGLTQRLEASPNGTHAVVLRPDAGVAVAEGNLTMVSQALPGFTTPLRFRLGQETEVTTEARQPYDAQALRAAFVHLAGGLGILSGAELERRADAFVQGKPGGPSDEITPDGIRGVETRTFQAILPAATRAQSFLGDLGAVNRTHDPLHTLRLAAGNLTATVSMSAVASDNRHLVAFPDGAVRYVWANLTADRDAVVDTHAAAELQKSGWGTLPAQHTHAAARQDSTYMTSSGCL